MTIEHVNAADPNIHEPKGVAAAAANKVYVSDGAASGAWQKITTDQLDPASVFAVNEKTIEYLVEDLSQSKSHFVVIPYDATVDKIYSVIDQSIATSDVTLTSKIAGAPVTGGVITITQVGSAAGDIDVVTPSGANTITAGQTFEIACDGATTTSGAHAHITLVLTRTA